MSLRGRINFSRFREVVLDFWASELDGDSSEGSASLSRMMLSVANQVAAAGVLSQYFDIESYSRWRGALSREASGSLLATTGIALNVEVASSSLSSVRIHGESGRDFLALLRETYGSNPNDVPVASLVLEELAQSPEVTRMLSALYEPEWPPRRIAQTIPILQDFDATAASLEEVSAQVLEDSWAIDGYYGWQRHLVQLGESILDEYLRFCQYSDDVVDVIASRENTGAGNGEIGTQYSDWVQSEFPDIGPSDLVPLVELWRTTAGWWTNPGRLIAGEETVARRHIRQTIRREIGYFATVESASQELRGMSTVRVSTRPLGLVVSDLTNVYRSVARSRRLYVEARARGFARSLTMNLRGSAVETYQSLVREYEVER